MSAMSSRRRIQAAVRRQPVDRLPIFEHFWPETPIRWAAEGHLPDAKVNLVDHFGLDMHTAGWPNLVADLDFENQVLEEDDESVLTLNGNGAKLRHMKHKANCPEHVGFTVQDRASWEQYARPFLVELDERRVPHKTYRDGLAYARENDKYFCFAGVAPFECMHPVCGHEYMLMGMALDPDWITDMVDVYVTLTIEILDKLFAAHGKPDGVFFYEDMGFKQRPFMSPAMYGELIQPGHARLFDFAHQHGLDVIVHSCGFVEPLLPGMIEAGMDCLQAIEVKAGMDLLHLAETFGDRISFCGGLDVRALISNDRSRIDAELDSKLPTLIEKGIGYIVHTDHSVPSEVDYDSLMYWLEKAGSYSTCGVGR